MSNNNSHNLTRRYLIWCYKTTKEDLDRMDRYFTQAPVDDFIYQELSQSQEYISDEAPREFKDEVKNFEEYKQIKLDKAKQQKYNDANNEILKPDYLYLTKRLAAIEEAIQHFLGKEELAVIIDLYEQEMTLRILQAREHT